MSRILALETTEKNATVAAWDDFRLIGERHPEGRSAQTLAPAIRELLQQIGWKSRDVECVAVGVGPGSFTGLRVGIATAKMFAYATGAKIIGVDTLLALAVGVGSRAKHVSVAVDAQRSEVVARNFEIGGELPIALGPQRIMPIAQWWEFGQNGAVDTVFTGPILHRIEKNVPPEIVLDDRSCWDPQAAHIGRIASQRFVQGDFDDLWTIVPRYSRPSAAEERRR